MKTNKFFLTLLLAISVIITSCNKDDDNEPETLPQNDIVQIAQSSGFNSLATALEITGLTDDLKTSGPFTVFAPTDEAFASLLETIGQTDINDVPVDVLEKVLLYHVVPSTFKSSELMDGDFTTLEGSDITISTTDGISVNGVSVVNPYDVEASNGVIHTINQVLVPTDIMMFVNTVLEPAYFNKNFSTLIAAAVKADLVGALLDAEGITIFAPDNNAFSMAGIVPANTDKDILAAVLTYHVVGAKVMSTEIPASAVTLNGGELFFSLTPNGAYINGNTMIKAVDIESGSGVVHVIDGVLLPPGGDIVDVTLSLADQGEFTSLVAALQRTATEGTPDQNLIMVLKGDGPFTVFAPTNQAFQILLDSNSDWNTLGDIPLDLLVTVLTYHVVPARAYDKDLPMVLNANNELPTAMGQPITIDLATLMINGNSNIIGVNTNASNGVIHVIDKVLLP